MHVVGTMRRTVWMLEIELNLKRAMSAMIG